MHGKHEHYPGQTVEKGYGVAQEDTAAQFPATGKQIGYSH
ncbi:unnamed protein product, partial [marine sediment metagenome]